MRSAWVPLLAGALCGCGGRPPAPAPASAADGLIRRFDLGLPERPWAVRCEWPDGVRVTRDYITADGATRKLMAVGSEGRVKLAVTIQPDTGRLGGAAAIRQRAWAGMQAHTRFPMVDTAVWDDGGRALVQFRVPQLRGYLVDRLERHCWLWRDGVVVHLQVSEDHADDATVKRFDGWTATAAIAARPVPPAAEALAFGIALADGDAGDGRERAVGLFDAAAAELADLTPPQQIRLAVHGTAAWIAADRWIDAVDLVHRLLERYPDEPRLHYARARAYASEGKEVDAVASLTQALALHAAAGGGGPLPDPSEDPLFLSLTGEDFTALLVKYGYAGPDDAARLPPGAAARPGRGDPGPSPGPDNGLQPKFSDG